MWRRDNYPPPYVPPEYRNEKYSEMLPHVQKEINVWVNKTSAAAGHAIHSFVVGVTIAICVIAVILGVIIAAVSKNCS